MKNSNLIDFKASSVPILVPRSKLISDVIEEFNGDLTFVNLKDVDASAAVLTNVKLPLDKNAFQKIKDKNLTYCIFPEADLSLYDFSGVNISLTKFPKNCKLPKDKDLFQKIKDKNLFFAALPEDDYSNYDFTGVNLEYTMFTKNSKLPKKKDFLIKLDKSSVYGAVLPSMCLENYILENVFIGRANLSACYGFPSDESFLEKLKYKCITDTVFPEHFDFSIYNTNGVICNSLEIKDGMRFFSMSLLNFIAKFTNIYPAANLRKFFHLYSFSDFDLSQIDKINNFKSKAMLSLYQKLIIENKVNNNID